MAKTLMLYGLLVAVFAGGCTWSYPNRPIKVGVYQAQSNVGKIVAIQTTLYLQFPIFGRPGLGWVKDEYKYEVDSDGKIQLDLSASDPMKPVELRWDKGGRILMHDPVGGVDEIFIFAKEPIVRKEPNVRPTTE